MIRLGRGSPDPLGATWDAERGGTNFAIFSEHATAVELCLFGAASGAEERLELPSRTEHVWHGFAPGISPGQRYGYRVQGRYAPREGQRFNRAKLLIDPYAKAISGRIDWNAPVFGYRFGRHSQDLTRDLRNSASGVPKSVVVDPAFDWGADRPPRTSWSETVIYEAHVKGLSMCHPEVPEQLRGTYLGLTHPAILEHLRSLGVTAVELLPVHQFVNDKFLLDRGLTNYWGYNSIGYFAPESRYSSTGEAGQQVTEFKQLVKALHSAGFEVILDVVY